LQFSLQAVSPETFGYTLVILVGKPEGRKTLGRPRLRWEENIRMDMREIG
jgi:hypothetical protein